MTWRDVQHIVVHTAKKTSPLDEGWKTNGAGLHFNPKFGFGKMDAFAMVKAGLKWKNVPPQHICKVLGKQKNVPIPYRHEVVVTLRTTGCRGQKNEVKKIEHVDITVTLRHRCRGDLNITVVSPSGTSSNLLAPRNLDISNKGLKDWSFMTVHLWGENPVGVWTLYIGDQGPSSLNKSAQDNEDLYRQILDDIKAHRARDFIPRAYYFMHDEVHHGQYKEEYMRDEIPSEEKRDPFQFTDEFSEKDILSRKDPSVGELTNWSITLYGTDQ